MKGLSPLLAVLILIGIAIAAGTSAFGILDQYSSDLDPGIKIRATESTITQVDVDNDVCFLKIGLMNVGGKVIDEYEIKTVDDNGLTITISSNDMPSDLRTIDPRETLPTLTNPDYHNQTSHFLEYDSSSEYCKAWSECKNYPMTIVAYSGDSSSSAATSLTCNQPGRLS